MNTHIFRSLRRAVFLLPLTLAMVSAAGAAPQEDMIERGRYLIKTSGCNDCHTPGYLKSNGETPVSQWLLGDTFGWRGPWGTTYPSNLRLFMSGLGEDQCLVGNLFGAPKQEVDQRPGRPHGKA